MNPRTPTNILKHTDPETPAGTDLATANRAHDRRNGFHPPRRREEDQRPDYAFHALPYPPYVPVPPGFNKDTTTEQEIQEWNGAWQQTHLANLGLTPTP